MEDEYKNLRITVKYSLETLNLIKSIIDQTILYRILKSPFGHFLNIASLTKARYQDTSILFLFASEFEHCFYKNLVKHIIIPTHPIESLHILNQLKQLKLIQTSTKVPVIE